MLLSSNPVLNQIKEVKDIHATDTITNHDFNAQHLNLSLVTFNLPLIAGKLKTSFHIC